MLTDFGCPFRCSFCPISNVDRSLRPLDKVIQEIKLLKSKDYIRYNIDSFKSEWGIDPINIIDLKALMGDSSDNIPGVPKVGEKTASELIIKYHSLNGIYENVEEISKDSIRNSLKDNKDLAYLCLKLATIETNAPVDVDFSELKNELTYSEGGYNILQELGLRTYLKKFEDNMSKIKNDVSLDNLNVTEIESNDALMSLLNGVNNASVSLVKGTFGSVIGIDDKFYKISFMMNVNPFVRKVLFDGDNKLIVFKASDAFEMLEDDDFKKQSRDIIKNIYALDLAAYLLNPLNSSYTAESLLSDYLGITVRSDSLDAKEQALVAYGFIKLKKDFDERLSETRQYKLYTDIELPLSLVLFEMEKTGILVDRDGLKKYEEDLTVSIDALEKKIYEEAGEEFNILSPKQLGVILFEKMNMPSSKKTKTGYSTSADVLEKLAQDYPFVSNILEYRTLTKLKSTYAVGLASAIGSDGRIHSHFLQTVTATGRISSAEPNLQNIPVRTDLGRQLRKVFIPKDGCIFADADYSQIELRILAHLSNDTTLIDAFNSDKDIHAVTASKVFDVPIDEITPSQRRAAKVVNFGIIYGMSSFSLGQDLEITRKEAEKYIKEYFEGYSGIRTYLDNCVEFAKENGYSLTAFLRRRPIPELKASQFMQREFGRRVAMNAPIQGTAADIMKIAMINVRDALKRNGLSSEILIQVHDELLLEIKENEKEEVVKILKTEMENAYKLSVPLSVDLNVGENWYEAK